jgi:hypothetical protein
MRTFSILVILILFYLFNCKKSEFILEEVDPASVSKINTVGYHSANLLVVALKGKVIEAIGQGGLVNAISVCSDKGLFLTDSIARNLSHVIEIKRTSYKYRNAKNAPDAIDQKVLDNFLHDKVFEQAKIFRIVVGDTIYYRYYQPLKVAGLCVNCHGKTETMDRTVIEKINQKYPGDLAREYAVGDFRGVVCVTIADF